MEFQEYTREEQNYFANLQLKYRDEVLKITEKYNAATNEDEKQKLYDEIISISQEVTEKTNDLLGAVRRKRIEKLAKNQDAFLEYVCQGVDYVIDDIADRIQNALKEKKLEAYNVNHYIIEANNIMLPAKYQKADGYYIRAEKLTEEIQHRIDIFASRLHKEEEKKYTAYMRRQVSKMPNVIKGQEDIFSMYDALKVFAVPEPCGKAITWFFDELKPQYMREKLGKNYDNSIMLILDNDTLTGLEKLDAIQNAELLSNRDMAIMYSELETKRRRKEIDKQKNINTLATDNWITPKDVLSNTRIWTGDFLTTGESNIQEVEVQNRKNKKVVFTKLSINFDAPNLEIKSPVPLDAYARVVHDACCSLLAAGNEYITPRMIWRTVTGDNAATISKRQGEEITDYMEQLMRSYIKIDATDEAKQYGYEYFKQEGHIIEAERTQAKLKGQPGIDAYHILGKPILHRYADMKNQVGRVDIKLLDIPRMNLNKETIELREDLMHRIMAIKGGGISKHIRLDSIYADMNVDDNKPHARDEKKKIRDRIEKMLAYWKKEKFIFNYSYHKTGNTVDSIEIDTGIIEAKAKTKKN